jgi:hypothetical protein
LLITGFVFILGCEKDVTQENLASLEQKKCFRGILVKKGICGQRVIQISSQNKDAVSYATQWKDEISGKRYENVFTVDNSCAFPAAIKEGEEFNFELTADKANDCVQCAAYTPVPKEKNSIIVSTNCTEQEK